MNRRLIVFVLLFALALGGFWAAEQLMFSAVNNAKQSAELPQQ